MEFSITNKVPFVFFFCISIIKVCGLLGLCCEARGILLCLGVAILLISLFCLLGLYLNHKELNVLSNKQCDIILFAYSVDC